jgi:adenine-specific DNA-methyltransferase
MKKPAEAAAEKRTHEGREGKGRSQPVARLSADELAERVEELKELFPESLVEGKIDFDKLRETLGEEVDSRPERYSFTWAGKHDCIRLL